MSRKITVWVLVVVLWPVLLLGESPESGQIASQSAKNEAMVVDSSAAEQQPVNGGFELGKVGVQPAGWSVRDIPGYKITTSDEQPAVGRQCATIVSTAGSEPSPFGNLLQKIDARPFRGHRVRLRGAVRTEVRGKGNRAQMWFRVDRRAQDGARPRGAFDNMFNRPITSSDWIHYEIIADVDVDALDITLGVFLRGEGKAWVDDVSLEIVGAEVPVTARRPGGGRTGGTSFDELRPGLFEIVSATRLTPNVNNPSGGSEPKKGPRGSSDPQQQTLLLPLPLSYRDQVPISFQLSVRPPGAVDAIDIYEDLANNHVAKLTVGNVRHWKQVDVTLTSTVLVGPSRFDAVPDSTPIPEAWPTEAEPWLAATWCADANNERIVALATEIRADTDDVRQIIRRVEQSANNVFRSAEGQPENLTAVAALDTLGSCTSCANLVAALLRASGVPARVLSGYPAWSPPLQTHYIVEAYVPDFGWYPIESTFCQSPWPNTHQVHVAIVPPEYEQQSKADGRCWAFAGVPYLSLTEMPDNTGSVEAVGIVDESRNCDHVCRSVRTLEGSPDQWQQAIADARTRWQNWLATSHDLDADGQLQFGKRPDDISATSVSALVTELDR